MIGDIRLHYSEIRANLNTYDTTIIEIWHESTEGGQAIAYYDKADLKLIKVVWLGETGKKQIEYYFNDGELIFARPSRSYSTGPFCVRCHRRQ